MVESTTQQLPSAAPTPPTTWSESQVHLQTNFQTASSPAEIHRSKRYSVCFASSSRRSQDRSIYGSSAWRSAIPFKKPSLNSATWQTPFSTRPLPTQQRHGQATYLLRNPQESTRHLPCHLLPQVLLKMKTSRVRPHHPGTQL